MKGDGDLADLALGVAGDEEDVVALPQNQSSSSPVRGQLCDPRVQLRSARRSYSRSLDPVAWNLRAGRRSRNLHRACGQNIYNNLGINGSQNLPEPLLACQGRVRLWISGCQIPKGHVPGLSPRRLVTGCGKASLAGKSLPYHV